jgi:hypothetical protein
LPIHGQAEIANRAAFRRVADLRVTREIAEENDFVEAGQSPVLPVLLRWRQLFWCPLLFFNFCAQSLVVLPVNFGVELKLRTQFGNELRIGMKDKIDVKSGVERSGHVSKLPFVHFLDLLDFRAFFLNSDSRRSTISLILSSLPCVLSTIRAS